MYQNVGNQFDAELTSGGVNKAHYNGSFVCTHAAYMRTFRPQPYMLAFCKCLRQLERLREVGASSALASACGSSNACMPPTCGHSAYITCGTLHLHADNRLHYMCMPLTCWSLQALADARTLVGCRHSVGDDHKGFLSHYMSATAYACKMLERARLCRPG